MDQDCEDTFSKEMKLRAWGDGPWVNEPDFLEFEHSGFKCIIRRSITTGALCGYVVVPKGHPWFGKDMFEIECECHGGITWSSEVEGRGDQWIVGFDCAHHNDLSPALEALKERYKGVVDFLKKEHIADHFKVLFESVYRDIPYVTEQVQGVASQAREVANVL